MCVLAGIIEWSFSRHLIYSLPIGGNIYKREVNTYTVHLIQLKHVKYKYLDKFEMKFPFFVLKAVNSGLLKVEAVFSLTCCASPSWEVADLADCIPVTGIWQTGWAGMIIKPEIV